MRKKNIAAIFMASAIMAATLITLEHFANTSRKGGGLMKDIQKGGIQRNTGLRTLHACLMALGAKRKEVYVGFNDYEYGNKNKGSIYNRYSYEQLHWWLDELYQQNFKWHPDLHPEDREFYGKKMALANAAYQKAKKILRWRKSQWQ